MATTAASLKKWLAECGPDASVAVFHRNEATQPLRPFSGRKVRTSQFRMDGEHILSALWWARDCRGCGNEGSTALFGDEPGSGNDPCRACEGEDK